MDFEEEEVPPPTSAAERAELPSCNVMAPEDADPGDFHLRLLLCKYIYINKTKPF